MATKHPRVQVTVDPELAQAIAKVDLRPVSRSRLIRDLALRGASAMRAERDRQTEAREYLLRVVNGEVDLDFEASRELYEARGEPCP